MFNQNQMNSQLQQMFGNNPNFNRAMQMTYGKSPEQIQQTVLNLASSQGLSMNDLRQIAAKFGFQL